MQSRGPTDPIDHRTVGSAHLTLLFSDALVAWDGQAPKGPRAGWRLT
jgi:hypothetical protein